MIVVLSLNTSLDRILDVPNFSPGEVNRAAGSAVFAGGKGLNVARVLRQLGHSVRVVGLLGGTPTEVIRRQCDALGIEQRWVAIPGESRTCVIIADPVTEQQTVVNEKGPPISPSILPGLRDTIERSVSDGDLLCISGSAPPGVPDNLYADLVRVLQGRGVRVLVDVSGVPLAASLDARPWAAAPNREEYGAIGGDGPPRHQVTKLAEETRHAILTLGKDGALYAADNRVVHLRPPHVLTVNAVGSGDALVAGFLAGTEQGETGLDALRLGVACGASNAASREPGIESRDAVEALWNAVTISEVADT